MAITLRYRGWTSEKFVPLATRLPCRIANLPILRRASAAKPNAKLIVVARFGMIRSGAKGYQVVDNGQSQPQSWMRQLVDGEDQAVAAFWQEYGQRLQRLAEKHLTLRVRQRVGPEDVVQSACRTFFRRAKQGELQLTDSESLWRLMCAITLAKVRQQARFHFRQKRSVLAEKHLESQVDSQQGEDPQLACRDPGPEEAVEFADELERLLQDFDDEQQQLVKLKLENYTNEEIATQMGCSERTVRRLLQRVKSQLARTLEQSCFETA